MLPGVGEVAAPRKSCMPLTALRLSLAKLNLRHHLTIALMRAGNGQCWHHPVLCRRDPPCCRGAVGLVLPRAAARAAAPRQKAAASFQSPSAVAQAQIAAAAQEAASSAIAKAASAATATKPGHVNVC